MADPYIISMSAFLALAGQCGDGISPQTLAQLTSAESSFNIIAININAGAHGHAVGTVRGIKNKTQAIALARSLHLAGVSFDAGVAQINSKNFEWLGLTPETAFDPCENIRAQAHYLKSFSRYNTGSQTRGFDNGYVKKIVGGKERIRALIDNATTETKPNEAPPNPQLNLSCQEPPKWVIGQAARYAGECSRATDKVPATPIKRIVREYP